MPSTVVPGILTVGIYDHCWRGFDASVTHGQALPPTFRYVDNCDDPAIVDIAMATHTNAAALADSKHPRRVWWMQECSELYDWNTFAGWRFPFYDLVLTCRDDLIASAPARHRWMSLVGTWITDTAPVPKTRSVSMISSAKSFTSGHRLRHEVKALVDGYDGFGELFGGRIESKAAALAPYRFTIVIESSQTATWITEKLCDAFACKTIPLYFGPPSLSRLVDLGFRVGGIIPWHTIAGLRDYLDLIQAHPEEWYADRLAAVEHNARRIAELRCTEILLERTLREHFDLA